MGKHLVECAKHDFEMFCIYFSMFFACIYHRAGALKPSAIQQYTAIYIQIISMLNLCMFFGDCLRCSRLFNPDCFDHTFSSASTQAAREEKNKLWLNQRVQRMYIIGFPIAAFCTFVHHRLYRVDVRCGTMFQRIEIHFHSSETNSLMFCFVFFRFIRNTVLGAWRTCNIDESYRCAAVKLPNRNRRNRKKTSQKYQLIIWWSLTRWKRELRVDVTCLTPALQWKSIKLFERESNNYEPTATKKNMKRTTSIPTRTRMERLRMATMKSNGARSLLDSRGQLKLIYQIGF